MNDEDDYILVFEDYNVIMKDVSGPACHTKRFPTDYERLKKKKIGVKIGEKFGHVILGNRSKVNHLGVTQPDYQIV